MPKRTMCFEVRYDSGPFGLINKSYSFEADFSYEGNPNTMKKLDLLKTVDKTLKPKMKGKYEIELIRINGEPVTTVEENSYLVNEDRYIVKLKKRK